MQSIDAFCDLTESESGRVELPTSVNGYAKGFLEASCTLHLMLTSSGAPGLMNVEAIRQNASYWLCCTRSEGMEKSPCLYLRRHVEHDVRGGLEMDRIADFDCHELPWFTARVISRGRDEHRMLRTPTYPPLAYLESMRGQRTRATRFMLDGDGQFNGQRKRGARALGLRNPSTVLPHDKTLSLRRYRSTSSIDAARHGG